MKYQHFDIVMVRANYSAKIYALVELAPDSPHDTYLAVPLERGPLKKRFRLRDEQILAKLGTLDPAALTLDPDRAEPANEVEWQLGRQFAQYMAEHALTEEDRRRWAFLASLKPGDCVPIHRYLRGGQRIEHHRFQQVLLGGQKYNFVARNANGTAYSWMLDAMYLGPQQKRP